MMDRVTHVPVSMLVMLCAMVAFGLPGVAHGEDLGTSISSLKPPVKVKLDGREHWTNVSGDGIRLQSLDEVKIGKGGLMKLDSEQGDQIKVSENSQLDVDLNKEGLSTIELDVGAINVKFNDETPVFRTLKVSTNNGIVGVRGTHFSVIHNGRGRTGVSVFEGEVIVRDRTGKQVTVERGERVRIRGDQLAGPPERNWGSSGTRNEESTHSTSSLHEATWERWETRIKLHKQRERKQQLELRGRAPGSAQPDRQNAELSGPSLETIERKVSGLEEKLTNLNKRIQRTAPELGVVSVKGPTSRARSNRDADVPTKGEKVTTSPGVDGSRIDSKGELSTDGSRESMPSAGETAGGQDLKQVPDAGDGVDVTMDRPSNTEFEAGHEVLSPDQFEVKTDISSPDEFTE